jgi:uncharacterized protein
LTAFYPGQVTIDAYGAHGFRFAGMSHQGSLLALPSGIHAWNPGEVLTPGDFAAVFDEGDRVALFLLGTGFAMARPPRAVRDAFASRGLSLEAMDTGAALSTYNLLLGEKRRVAAGLIVPGQVG